MKNNSLVNLNSNIFWKVTKISIGKEIDIHSFRYKNKQNHHMTMKHEYTPFGWLVISDHYFKNKKQLKLFGKPGISVIYVEEKHLLKQFFFMLFWKLETIIWFVPIKLTGLIFNNENLFNEFLEDKKSYSIPYRITQWIRKAPYQFGISKYFDGRFRRKIYCINTPKITNK